MSTTNIKLESGRTIKLTSEERAELKRLLGGSKQFYLVSESDSIELGDTFVVKPGIDSDGDKAVISEGGDEYYVGKIEGDEEWWIEYR